MTDSENVFPRQLSPEVLQALRGVRFIAQHIKEADKDNEVRNRKFNEYSTNKRITFSLRFHCFVQIVQDWKFVSMVLDRFFLWVFTLSCIGGTLGIIFQSPSLYDTRSSLAPEYSEIKIAKDLPSALQTELRKLTIFDDPLGT